MRVRCVTACTIIRPIRTNQRYNCCEPGFSTHWPVSKIVLLLQSSKTLKNLVGHDKVENLVENVWFFLFVCCFTTGALQPGQTVVEATSGNTGIALAMVCAAKGYPLIVTMAESFSVERRKIMRALGAKVILTPAAERGTGMVLKVNFVADSTNTHSGSA